MENHLVEERIRGLEHRLHQVEGKPSTKKGANSWRLNLKDPEERARFFGWAITALSLIGFVSGWTNISPTIGLLFAISLIIGLVLIVSASGLIGHSDSYLKLAQEERAGKQVHSGTVHHRVATPETKWGVPSTEKLILVGGFLLLAFLMGWALILSVSNPFLQVMPATLIITIVGVWATIQRKRAFAFGSIVIIAVLLCVAAEPLTALMAALASFAVIWIAAWDGQDLDILSASGFALTVVSFGQAYWGINRLSEVDRTAAVISALMGVLLTGLAYSSARRSLKRRDLSRIGLIFSPLVALAVITAAGPYNYAQNLLAGLILIAVGYGAMAYVGWISHQRFSYAKYFLAAALSMLLLFVYLLLDPVAVVLIWFILSIVVTAAGFTLPSYSARLMGMGLLIIAVLHYFLTVLGAPQVAGPIILHDRVWLGLVLGLFMPALALWYQEGKLRGVEARLVPVVASSLSATGFLILFAIGYLDIPSPYQSVLWMALGIGAICYGRYSKLGLIAKGGIVLLLFSALKLVGFDILAIPLGNRIMVLLGVAILLIILGFVLPRRSNRERSIL